MNPICAQVYTAVVLFFAESKQLGLSYGGIKQRACLRLQTGSLCLKSGAVRLMRAVSKL
jgi:hypothetical protein